LYHILGFSCTTKFKKFAVQNEKRAALRKTKHQKPQGGRKSLSSRPPNGLSTLDMCIRIIATRVRHESSRASLPRLDGSQPNDEYFIKNP